MVNWSLHSRDTRFTDPARVARHVLNKVQPGDIVLLHDGHDLPGHQRTVCVQATELILQGLAQRGLQCVTVSELLDDRA
jgi:peptidoglycan/xylan/chitin deacetylase (PgdA/CDA1 family)